MESLVEMIKAYRNKKVFITGHTGFKGCWLTHALEFLGAKVYGYSLEPHTTPSHFNLMDSKSDSTIGDICDLESLQTALIASEAEIVFHLAAQSLVRESYRNAVKTYQVNVIGTLNVLEAIKNCSSVKSVIVVTTDKVYENKEWEYPYRETDELGGYDLYSSSKACTEILANSYNRSFFKNTDRNVLLATARAGNVIGGGDWNADRLIPDIARAASNDENVIIRNLFSIRPWQHVLDCLNGYLQLGAKLMEGNTAFTGAWNFAPYAHDTKTVGEVLEVSKKSWNKVHTDVATAGDHMHESSVLKLDNSKAVEKLCWKPIWKTDVAIEKTMEWYKAYYEQENVITKDQIKEFFNAYGIY